MLLLVILTMSRRNFASPSAKGTLHNKLRDWFKLEICVLFYFFEFFKAQTFLFGAHTALHLGILNILLDGTFGALSGVKTTRPDCG